VIHAAEQQRPDVQARRTAWTLERLGWKASQLVFIDESGFRTNMARQYGRAPRGRRVVDYVPHGHWKTTTFIAALRHRGWTAPMVLDGAMNGRAFLAYVRQVLAPTLSRGDVVILDNLSSHKQAGVREAIEACEASVVYLPPYSPDLNPIELAFSKLKSLVRSAGQRTVDGLWSSLGELLDRFAPHECQNYLRHCGYSVTLT